MHFITRIYQVVSLPAHGHNARYEARKRPTQRH